MAKIGGSVPIFEGKNFAYWKARMRAYLEAIAPEVWEATHAGYGDHNYIGDQIKWDAKARNAIYECISQDVFARIASKEKACEIWACLIEIHEGSSRVKELKYHMLKAKYDEFKMLPHENVNEMFSRLNVLIEEINALDIAPLGKGLINRKILMLLPKPKYNIINSMLQKESLDHIEVSELIGEIRAHEMSVLGMMEESSSKTIALKASTKRTNLKKKKVVEPSSSEEEQASSEDDDDELALMMRKFSRLNSKIAKKGYNFDPKKKAFLPRKDDNKTCYNCGDQGHISYDCPKPDKRRENHKGKHRKFEDSEDDEEEVKPKPRFFGKKKYDKGKKAKLFLKKRKGPQKVFMCEANEWVTDEESSDEESEVEEESLAGLAIANNDDSSLHPPPMCLMAKGNTKVCDDSSDDELSPDDLASMINEYHTIIKREKSKVKALEEARAKLESANLDLLDKYESILKEHDTLKSHVKQVEEDKAKIKLDHHELDLAHKALLGKHNELIQEHQVLDLAYEVIDQELKTIKKETLNDKVSIASHATNVLHKSLPLKENAREKDLMDEIESLRTSVARLSKGEVKHKEILFQHAKAFNKRGLGSFPVPNKGKVPSPELKTSFIKEVGSYCQHCEVTGHHTRECPLPNRPSPKLPTNFKSIFDDHYYLLSKVDGKVKARFIGKDMKGMKGKLPKQLWVPKTLVSHIQGPKLAWVPKIKN